jgi:protein-tyrosine phosphatase
MDGSFREVALPESVPGALFVSSMPGRFHPIGQATAQMRRCRIDRLVCLAPEDEVRWKSPDYAKALRHRKLPCPVRFFPIPDFGEPHDRHAFVALVRQIGDELRQGRRLLVHCAAGFGRTGTVATCVLVSLGVTQDRAREAIRAAGARPEFDVARWLDSAEAEATG